jgi:hypothetical protein
MNLKAKLGRGFEYNANEPSETENGAKWSILYMISSLPVQRITLTARETAWRSSAAIVYRAAKNYLFIIAPRSV